jgi:hypothetical protein
MSLTAVAASGQALRCGTKGALVLVGLTYPRELRRNFADRVSRS